MEFEAYRPIHERIFRENGLEGYLNTAEIDANVSRETDHGEALSKNSALRVSRETDPTASFWRLTEHMLTVNEQMNLTAVRDVESVIYLHYADSLMIADAIPQGVTLCDVGCGAGFPSLPLAIARPDLSFFALDSTEKKVRYVGETAKMLGFGDRFTAISARAEELGQGEKRECFSAVTARAVSNLRMLSELCLPLVSVGGVFLSMKGAGWKDEWRDAEGAIKTLGGTLENAREFEIRNGALSEKRCLLVIRKTASTPAKYPRAWGKIKSKPL